MKLSKYLLALGAPPICRSGLEPKKYLEGERDNQEQVITGNHNNNKHAWYKDFFWGSGAPLRSTHVPIVEVTTKVGVFLHLLASLKQTKVNLSSSLENRGWYKLSKVLPQIGSSWAMPSWLGAKPQESQTQIQLAWWRNQVLKFWIDVSLTQSLLSTQTIARFQARSKGERREELLVVRRCFGPRGVRVEWVGYS